MTLIRIHSRRAKVNRALGTSAMCPNDPWWGTIRMMIVKGSREELLRELCQHSSRSRTLSEIWESYLSSLPYPPSLTKPHSYYLIALISTILCPKAFFSIDLWNGPPTALPSPCWLLQFALHTVASVIFQNANTDCETILLKSSSGFSFPLGSFQNFLFYFILFLATPRSLWNFSSLTRDWTQALGSKSVES